MRTCMSLTAEASFSGLILVKINMETKTKRPRKPNFTNEEVTMLLEEISIERRLLMSAVCSDITNKQKIATWSRIANKISACGVCERSIEEIRDKWKNLKADVIKRQQDSRKTGGGPPKKPGAFDDLILLIIGEGTALIEGIPSAVPDTFQMSQQLLPASSTCYPTASSDASEEFAVVAEASEDVIDISAIVPEVQVHCELEDTVIHIPVRVATPPSASTPAPKKGLKKRSLSLRRQHSIQNSGQGDDETRLWKEFLKSEIKKNQSEVLKNEMHVKKMENDMKEAQDRRKRDEEEFKIKMSLFRVWHEKALKDMNKESVPNQNIGVAFDNF